ncbi:HNH endonuclease signature motif containing protein [Pseudonocardia sp.]|uniref:HNH endonuclease signature motif containing protein n=1 Tax=Pseudonocardia sp. TaxID=60912 RepID=UPI002F4217FD
MEIRVGLATLLGLDERCGQLGGFDYVLPEITRRRVAKQYRGAEWRFAVTDTEGHIVFGGLTRRRPLLPAGQPPGRCRGGIVELHIPAELLAALTGDGPGALSAGLSRWAAVLADIAAQYADRERLLAQLDARPRDRFPHTGLDRFLRIRDRTCVAPGCRRSATTCQIDHTRDHAEGGPTTQANTAALCPSHHLRKSAGAWKMSQTRPGVFEWTSPLGRTYRTQAEPLNPPEPPTRSTHHQRQRDHPATPTTPPAEGPDPPPF